MISKIRVYTPIPQVFYDAQSDGFTLIELLIALVLLTFGLLSVGQLIYVAMSSISLARSKSNAAFIAQSKAEDLSVLYHRSGQTAELAEGEHGPQHTNVLNPRTHTALNRFSINWTVTSVPDPRPKIELRAKQICITVTPIASTLEPNKRVFQNKVVSITYILSPGGI